MFKYLIQIYILIRDHINLLEVARKSSISSLIQLSPSQFFSWITHNDFLPCSKTDYLSHNQYKPLQIQVVHILLGKAGLAIMKPRLRISRGQKSQICERKKNKHLPQILSWMNQLNFASLSQQEENVRLTLIFWSRRQQWQARNFLWNNK